MAKKGIKRGKTGSWSPERKAKWLKARWGKNMRNPTPSEISPISAPNMINVEVPREVGE